MDAVYFTCSPWLLWSNIFQRAKKQKTTKQTEEEEKNCRNKLGSLSCRTHKHTSHWQERKHRRDPLFPLTRTPTNTLLPYTNTNTHTNTEVGRGHAYLGRSVFTCGPEGAVKAHKSGYFACTWEPTKHFSLLSVILIAQHDSSAPNHPAPPPLLPPPSPARWLFFFLTVCGLLHLCSTTLNPWDGRVEWRVWGALRGQMVRR